MRHLKKFSYKVNKETDLNSCFKNSYNFNVLGIYLEFDEENDKLVLYII